MKMRLSDGDRESARDGLVPEGTYAARVKDCSETTSKKGNEMMVVDYQIVAGEARGMEVRDYIVDGFHEDKMRALLAAVGAALPKPDPETGRCEIDPADISGSRVTITVAHEPDREDPNHTWVRVREVAATRRQAQTAPATGEVAPEPDIPFDEPEPERLDDDEKVPF